MNRGTLYNRIKITFVVSPSINPYILDVQNCNYIIICDFVFLYLYVIDTIWAADLYGIYKASRRRAVVKSHTDRPRILYRS